MKRNLTYILLLMLTLTACGEYNKLLKSTDYEGKYEWAKKYFEMKKYSRSITLLEELVPIYKGTEKAEESLYLLARSFFQAKDYSSASQYFKTYYNTYPKGEYAELARYYTGYGYYLDSPEARLDQRDTYTAIDELQMFLEYYPTSDKKEDVLRYIFELQEKLAEKELLNAQLYYNLGGYMITMGNNYLSAVIVAQNALRDYPYSKLREEFYIIILRSKFEEAQISVLQKQQDRLREAIDEYYTYKNEYPEGKYMKEATRIFNNASKMMKN
ncbi:MAG: outer membrane protein assembly factor BamD [Bacteroidales bacterium]